MFGRDVVPRSRETDLRFICIFTPALSGQETHDADGSYAASE
ncbi:ectoine synthase [Roseovarius rhodophyticola]|uniref:Ectoine synthase n=1 Tax=Roseovarius rhodophyticola TaxID=3080827 RepID=A0ABZ2TK66_9RHOB|nr:ectoine synthase [Roseovarius sp. W115]MDV2930726.1 ectoine synthase [Roseovarius sp. W115]